MLRFNGHFVRTTTSSTYWSKCSTNEISTCSSTVMERVIHTSDRIENFLFGTQAMTCKAVRIVLQPRVMRRGRNGEDTQRILCGWDHAALDLKNPRRQTGNKGRRDRPTNITPNDDASRSKETCYSLFFCRSSQKICFQFGVVCLLLLVKQIIHRRVKKSTNENAVQ